MNNDYKTRLQQAMASFHASIFDKSTNQIKSQFIEYTDCPICQSKDAKFIFEKDFFHYHRCNNCSMVYMNPRLTMEATVSFYNSEVNRIYNEKKFDQKTNSTDVDDARNVENVNLLLDFQKKNQVAGKKILEIGCAKGVFLKAAKDAGFQVEGLELNKENCEIANKLIGGGVHPIDLFDMKYPDGKFDVVYMRDVIEHIHNPDHFIKEISRVLSPDGLLYLETHNIDGLIHKIVGSLHTVIFGFEHPVHWSPATISYVVAKHGMKVKSVNFKSADFKLKNIIRYFMQPTWTTVFPWKVSKIHHFVLKVLYSIFSRPGFKQLDDKLFPTLANGWKSGSTMKVIAMKKNNKVA
jgi:2-polyprenyl-3-methyl-5-hydroxy-6-metoxy-1,4-benzoquinol methylase